MKKIIWKWTTFNIIVLVWGLMMAGCASSEETAQEKTSPPPSPSATEMMQKEMVNLRTENANLRQQISKLEQDNRTLTAHSAELETQLAEIKERLMTTPPPPPTYTPPPPTPVVSPPFKLPSSNPTVTNARESYDLGLQTFHSRNYQDAASTFQAILDAGNAGDYEDNCYYWLGECAFGSKNYNEAIEHFQKVFAFSKSEKKDDAQMMIANSYSAMGDKANAKAEYQKIIDKYPASPFVAKAKARMSKL